MRLPPGTLSYFTPPRGLEEAMATPGLSQNDCQNLSALFLILPWLQAADVIDVDHKDADVADPERFVNVFARVDGRLPDLKRDLRNITDASTPPQRVFNGMLQYGPGAGIHRAEGSFIQKLYKFEMEPGGTVTIEIPEFNCPSDTLNADELPAIAITMPYWDGQSAFGTPVDDLLYATFRDMGLAKANYVAVAGTTSCFNVPSPLAKWAGAMTGRGVVTLEQVSNLDGSTRTFLFGESLGDVGQIALIGEQGELLNFDAARELQPGQRFITRSWTWGGLGILASSNFPWGHIQHPDLQDPDGEKRYLRLLGDARLADPETFSSAHDGGVNFAMCDGSVHTVPRSMTWQLYYGCGGLRDGTTERGF
jgi:prepilin-type processing-associated H-X9-DG protein